MSKNTQEPPMFRPDPNKDTAFYQTTRDTNAGHTRESLNTRSRREAERNQVAAETARINVMVAGERLQEITKQLRGIRECLDERAAQRDEPVTSPHVAAIGQSFGLYTLTEAEWAMISSMREATPDVRQNASNLIDEVMQAARHAATGYVFKDEHFDAVFGNKRCLGDTDPIDAIFGCDEEAPVNEEACDQWEVSGPLDKIVHDLTYNVFRVLILAEEFGAPVTEAPIKHGGTLGAVEIISNLIESLGRAIEAVQTATRKERT